MGQLTEADGDIRCDAIISRQDAITVGLRHYFTGNPCKRGHLARRFTVDAACASCKKIGTRAYRASNRDAVRERDRLKYAADPLKFRARTKATRAAHPDTMRAWHEENPGYFKEWYAANAEREREKIRVKRAKNPESFAIHGRNRRARVRAAEGNHTVEDVKRIRSLQKDRCGYCPTILKGRGHVDHIIALANGGTNWPSNLQLLCKPCNIAKKARDPIEFAQSLGMLL